MDYYIIYEFEKDNTIIWDTLYSSFEDARAEIAERIDNENMGQGGAVMEKIRMSGMLKSDEGELVAYIGDYKIQFYVKIVTLEPPRKN